MKEPTALGSPGALQKTAVRQFNKARSIAGRLGIHPKTLMRWADAGHIHRHKVNCRIVLFDEAEVAEFINRSKVA